MMKAVGDIASNMSAMTVILGERLGLYKAMADSKPVTSAELAAKTNTYERYIREWLASQAAAGYVNPTHRDIGSRIRPAKILHHKIRRPAFVPQWPWACKRC